MKEFNETANGVYVIAVTPFHPSGEIDFASIDRMVEYYIEAGAAGLTVLGMMGEAQKLTLAESHTIVQHVIKRVKGRVPVVAGVSAPGFAQMQSLTNMVMMDGAAAVMVAPPSALRTDDQIVSYYHQVSDFIGEIPFVLQDFPLATGVQISVPVLARIVRDIPACVCLKHEDWPGLEKISTLRSPGVLDRRISILCGNGGLFLPEEMARGADGAMTGFAYPEMMASVLAHHHAGTPEDGRDIFDAYLPLARFEQQPGLGLAIRKHVLAQRGIIASGALRRPGAGLTETTHAEIAHLMARQERRLDELGTT
jgi:4-hydroxy-tetrahydrodipicolinate synthase